MLQSLATGVVFLLAALAALVPTSSLATTKDPALKESNRCVRYYQPYERAYNMPKNLLRAVSTAESGKWHRQKNKSIAWPWTLNVKGQGYHYDSKREALAAIEQFQEKGYTSIDVGCMQVNLKYHPDAFHSLGQALEPKYNIGYAARFLMHNFARTNDWQQAISRYHNADPIRGQRYFDRVYKVWKSQDRSFKLASLGQPPRYHLVVQRKPITAPSHNISHITSNALQMFGNK